MSSTPDRSPPARQATCLRAALILTRGPARTRPPAGGSPAPSPETARAGDLGCGRPRGSPLGAASGPTPLSWPLEGGPMALKKLGHVVLKVRDLDRSEAFYTSVLGLVVTGRLPGRMVFFAVPGQHRLARPRPLEGGAGRGSPASSKQVGLFHVAWQVEREEDLRAFHDSLVARGVPVRADHGPRREPVRVLRGSRREHARGHLREAPGDLASRPEPVRRPRAPAVSRPRRADAAAPPRPRWSPS